MTQTGLIIASILLIIKKMNLVISILISYLYGSIPMGYLLGKMKGIDITKQGFKKIGTSNVYKVLGLPYAILTFVFDSTKGIVAILISKQLLSIPMELSFILGIAAIFGHNFPLWLKFKGHGRGVATSLGLSFYLIPSITIKVFVIYVLITLILKSSAPATPVFFTLLVIATWLTKTQIWTLYFTLSLFIVFILTRVIAGWKYFLQSSDKFKAFWNIFVWDRTE